MYNKVGIAKQQAMKIFNNSRLLGKKILGKTFCSHHTHELKQKKKQMNTLKIVGWGKENIL